MDNGVLPDGQYLNGGRACFFTYTFSDDPAYVLGFVSIMEGLTGKCLLVQGLINVLERRESPFEVIGEIQLPDLLYMSKTIRSDFA